MKTLHQQGFTLLELMFTVGIAAVVLLFGIPNMSDFLKNERIITSTNSLIADLMLARSKSVELNQPVILCSSSDQKTCNNSSFEKGWIVGIDEDESSTLGNTDTLIKVQQELPSDISVNGKLNIIIFNSRGFTPNLKTTDILSVCDSRKDSHSKAISFSPTGRISRGGTPSC